MERINTVLLIDEQMVNDDDDFICSAAEGTLQKSGIANDIKVVNNTQDALDYLKFQCCASPEWIIFDDSVSQADCFEFLNAFEHLAFTNKADILVIRLANENQDLLRAAGVHKFMAKPLYPGELKALHLRYKQKGGEELLRKAS